MTLPPPTYDLVLLLDTQAEESARAKILADARTSIQARGELVRDDDWGERPLSYPIDHHKSAEYHLFQFHVSDKELLGGLDRTLRITDGVMRFRLIKLKPGVPDPPDMRSSAVPPRPPEREPGGAPATDGPPPAPAGEAAPAPPAQTSEAVAAPEAGTAPAAAPAPVPAEAPGAEAEAPAAAESPEQAADSAEQPPAEAEQPDAPSADTPPGE